MSDDEPLLDDPPLSEFEPLLSELEPEPEDDEDPLLSCPDEGDDPPLSGPDGPLLPPPEDEDEDEPPLLESDGQLSCLDTTDPSGHIF